MHMQVQRQGDTTHACARMKCVTVSMCVCIDVVPVPRHGFDANSATSIDSSKHVSPQLPFGNATPNPTAHTSDASPFIQRCPPIFHIIGSRDSRPKG